MNKNKDEGLPFEPDGTLAETARRVSHKAHLEEDTIKALRGKFESEAIQSLEAYGGELVGIDPQYITERMNDVFGHLGWEFSVIRHDMLREVDEDGKVTGSAWVHGKLSILSSNGVPIKSVEQFGNNSVNRATGLGDVLKGATTNCFCKCCSFFDIAHEAYKGLLKLPDGAKKETKPYSQSSVTGEDKLASDKQLGMLFHLHNEASNLSEEDSQKYLTWRGRDKSKLTSKDASGWIKFLQGKK